MHRALYDFFLSLLVLSALLWLASLALPAELPCPVRIPTPMFHTDDCDCGSEGDLHGCCCAPVCQCVALDYEAALAKANNEGKPIVVFVNQRVFPVEGAIVTRVTSFPGVDFQVGVVVGVPIAWEQPDRKGQRHLVSLYGPRHTDHIRAFIEDYKARVKQRHFFLKVDCGPIG